MRDHFTKYISINARGQEYLIIVYDSKQHRDDLGPKENVEPKTVYRQIFRGPHKYKCI
jgi:hypothetical protein